MVAKYKLLCCFHFFFSLSPTILPLAKPHWVILSLVLLLFFMVVGMQSPSLKSQMLTEQPLNELEVSIYLFNGYNKDNLIVDLPLQWLQWWGLLHGTKTPRVLSLFHAVSPDSILNSLMTQESFHVNYYNLWYNENKLAVMIGILGIQHYTVKTT